MTLNTTFRAYSDVQLRNRIDASVWQEAFARFDTSQYARDIVVGLRTVFTPFYWRVAADYVDEYETAVNTGRGAPGYDVDIITDGNIAAAVGAVWPLDPEPPEA